MSRYRPLVRRGIKLITKEGKEALETELKYLMWRLRPEVTKALSDAAKEGDRSENAEYIYRKKQLREIDRRVRYLVKRNEELIVVRDTPEDTSRVFFGAKVWLEDEAGEELVIRIVGTDELDPKQGLISIDSPLAQACLRKQVDDEVKLDSPNGLRRYWVTEVHYS